MLFILLLLNLNLTPLSKKHLGLNIVWIFNTVKITYHTLLISPNHVNRDSSKEKYLWEP